jgi:transposase
VVTSGHLLALRVTPASEQERAQVADLAAQVQNVAESRVDVACVDQDYSGDQPLEAAAEQGIRLEGVKLPEVEKGCVLLPRRWVVECSFARTACFRRLERDYACLPQTQVGLYFLASGSLMLQRFIHLIVHCLCCA